MGDVAFRPVEPGDVANLAPRLRPMDRLECRAWGYDPLSALELSVERAIWVVTATVDGQPEALLGVGARSLAGGLGTPWLLGTVKAAAQRRAFLLTAPRVIAHIEAMFPRLENYVHQRNAVSIRWLTRLGFVVEPEAVHIGGEPMLRFHKGF